MRQLLAQIIYLLSHHVSRFTFISHWLCKEMNTTTGAVPFTHQMPFLNSDTKHKTTTRLLTAIFQVNLG